MQSFASDSDNVSALADNGWQAMRLGDSPGEQRETCEASEGRARVAVRENFHVAGIGELLWDLFPTHRRLGGAPTNFAYHCGQLGATALRDGDSIELVHFVGGG